MKSISCIILIILLSICLVNGQENDPGNVCITLMKPDFSRDMDKIKYIDLDGDDDPDVLINVMNNGIPVQWIDDDDDMQYGDWEGDTDDDCMMINRNNDDQFGGPEDLIIDWNDENDDEIADMQIIVDNWKDDGKKWDAGHFMINIDTDNDGIYNYIDWATLKLEAWEHSGKANFFEDYHGHSLFIKIHTSTFNIEDLRYSWENPFLFYDTDNDGLTEMTVRFADKPHIPEKRTGKLALSHKISDARLALDLDNDNAPGNEFDFDLSIGYKGTGFNYSAHIHEYKSMRGLPEADTFFYDPRWRQNNKLIYVDHHSARKIMHEQGSWNECFLAFDEDDDCHRWERVEFYHPGQLFITGAKEGGLDSNPQADVSGDRGEWDKDASGNGNIYIGKFDGRIHLYGAEWGAWRIDQHSWYYQGWQGWRGGADSIPFDECQKSPDIFATVKYEDTDNNGFYDLICSDFNGDHIMEDTLSYNELQLSDSSEVFITQNMDYEDFHELFTQVAENMWERSQDAVFLAKEAGINTSWYALFQSPRSTREKYHQGFWLNHYIYRELMEMAHVHNDKKMIESLKKAFLLGNWKLIEWTD